MLIVICIPIFVYFFLLYHFWNMVSLYCLAQAALTFVVLLPLPLSTGITGQHSHTQIKNLLIYIWRTSEQLLLKVQCRWGWDEGKTTWRRSSVVPSYLMKHPSRGYYGDIAEMQLESTLGWLGEWEYSLDYGGSHQIGWKNSAKPSFLKKKSCSRSFKFKAARVSGLLAYSVGFGLPTHYNAERKCCRHSLPVSSSPSHPLSSYPLLALVL